MNEYEQIITNDNVLIGEDFFCPYNVGAKPFLKWAGGKGQLITQFQKFYPEQLRNNSIKNYYEPFLGSGAVFFDIVQHYNIKNAYLYDINEDLIVTYKVLQNDPSNLLERLSQYQQQYSKLNKKQQHDFFYNQREQFNQQRAVVNYDVMSNQWFARAAQMIFLNKTCFNGLYRVNLRGEFNVPIGSYENPVICDEQNIMAVHQVLQIAEIKRANYTALLSDILSDSFVYFDPPYRPISRTANFKSYSHLDFTDNEQIQLSLLFTQLDKKSICLMLSNSDPKNTNSDDNFFDDIYRNYNIYRVPARRMINSNGSRRGKINEIIVTNYSIPSHETGY